MSKEQHAVLWLGFGLIIVQLMFGGGWSSLWGTLKGSGGSSTPSSSPSKSTPSKTPTKEANPTTPLM